MAQIPLQQLLKREGKSIWQVHRATKIHYNRLMQYCENKAVMLKLSDVEKLCAELNCQPADLVVLTNGNGKNGKAKSRK